MNKKLRDMIKEYSSCLELKDVDSNVLIEISDDIKDILHNKSISCGISIFDGKARNTVSLDTIYKLEELCYFDYDEMLTYNRSKYVKPIEYKVGVKFKDDWMYESDCERVVIYHANCKDGHGVKAIMKLLNIHAEYMPLQYGSYDFEQLKLSLANKLVYVSDFSFNIEECNKLEKVVKSMVIVDHHDTPFKSPVADLKYTHFDMCKSGTRLTWEFWKSSLGADIPLMVKLIEDRDIWNFFYSPYTEALEIAISTFGMEIIDKYLCNDASLKALLSSFMEYGIDEKLRKDISKSKNTLPMTIDGIKFQSINLTSGMSEILNLISLEHNLPAISYYIDSNERALICSLRSSIEEVDVGEIASRFGGGGHKAASGFKIKLEDIDLNKFFINGELNSNEKIKSKQ